MRIKVEKGAVVVTRTKGDIRPSSESQLLYWIRDRLREQGHDMIKRLMWKDGHLVADTQHYLRERNWKWACWDSQYAVGDLAENFWNIGEVRLQREVWE